MDFNTLLTFLGSATGAGLVAAFLLLVAYRYLFPDVKENTRRWAKGLGFIFALICAAALLGVPLLSSSTAPPAQTAGSYTVTASDALAYVSEDNAQHTVTVAMNYNFATSTFNSSTNTVVVQFNIIRGLGNIGLVQTSVAVSSIPTITGINGIAHPIVATSSGLPAATWNQSGVGSANSMMTVNIAETASGAVLTLTMTIDNGAVHVMKLYDSMAIGLSVAGQSWTVNCLLATAGNYPGGWTGS